VSGSGPHGPYRRGGSLSRRDRDPGVLRRLSHLPGKRYLDRPLPDPNGKYLSEVKGILDDIAHRVSDLLAELPEPPTGLSPPA
jgi:hypothetical protein